MRFVTGASENHAQPLLRLLASIAVCEPSAPVIVWDLGLTEGQRIALACLPKIDLRRFPFERYPGHVARLDCFAWKPLLIRDTLAEGADLLWLDAGDLVHRPLTEIRGIIGWQGLYTPFGWGASCIRYATHRQTLERLHASDDICRRRFRHGAVVGLGYDRLDFAERWAAAALDPDVICPPGATRGNHHFDQSILSVLAYQTADIEGWELEGRALGVSYCNDTRMRAVFEGGGIKCVPVYR
jgi:hypothetical protein